MNDQTGTKNVNSSAVMTPNGYPATSASAGGSARCKSADLHHSYHNVDHSVNGPAPNQRVESVKNQLMNTGGVTPPTANSWSSPFSADNVMQPTMNAAPNMPGDTPVSEGKMAQVIQ